MFQCSRSIFFIVLLALSHQLVGQVNLDSLKSVWENPEEADTNRYKALMQFSWEGYLFKKPDSAYYFAQILYDLAEENGNRKYMAKAMNVQGSSFYVKGEFEDAEKYYKQVIEILGEIGDSIGVRTGLNNLGALSQKMGRPKQALTYYENCLEVDQSLDNKEFIAETLNNIGIVNNDMGNTNKAIEYYTKSLQVSELINDEKGISRCYNNIGNVYDDLNDYEKSLEYYEKSLRMKEKLNDKFGAATTLNNLGNYYAEIGEYKKSDSLYEVSLNTRKEIGDYKGVASTLDNMAMSQQEQGFYSTALKLFKEAFEIRNEIGYVRGLAISNNFIGEQYFLLKDYPESLSYLDKAFSLAKEIEALEILMYSTKSLFEIHKTLGNPRRALENYELHITYRDSLKSEENKNEVIRQEYKYAYEKQAAADSVKAAEEAKVKDAELAAEHAENVRRKQQSYFLYGGLALALVFGGFIFNRYKVTSQQKEIISEQKEEVDKAYVELEDKNQKILDSITYAKRIQNAILPPVKVVKEYLHDSFIIYLPKDVVAGDFYWLEAFAKASASKGSTFEATASEESITDASASEGTKILFAAADCTGHGVPGAMVSVVCNNGLNRSVREHGLTDPGKILDKTREIVVKEFEKSEEEVKDGMDIALCVLDGNTLEYAGAHNPLVIVRKGAEECEVIKPNKQPIGQFDNPQPYTTHNLELNEGDSIYLFSDGFQDQFGGPKGKKFMISRFKKLLVEVSKEPMNKQREMILKAFNDWKGNEEQVDDVCVIGVRV